MTESFIMVHVARIPVPLAQVFDELRPGDIVTHIFHSAENNILDENGRVRSEVKEAKSKGIVFDIGAGYFAKDISRAAIEEGVLPSTISTDITKQSFYEKLNPGTDALVYTLPEVMTPYMAMGMSLEEVIAATTCNAAAAMGLSDTLGTLRVRAEGDAAVLDLERGDFTTKDTDGVPIHCDQRITAAMTVKGGRVWSPEEK
jgi:dihydroorotase